MGMGLEEHSRAKLWASEYSCQFYRYSSSCSRGIMATVSAQMNEQTDGQMGQPKN